MDWFLPNLLVCLELATACSAYSISARNTTISVPDNVINRNGLLCTPAKWTTYVAFYVGNYVAHVATVRTLPGETVISTIFCCILALVFPSFGVSKGLDAVFRCARIRGRKSPLETAAHSGALCMVVRSKKWMPTYGNHKMGGVLLSDGDNADRMEVGSVSSPRHHSSSQPCICVYRAPCLDDGGWFWGHSELGLVGGRMEREIHGTYTLPEGYEWAIVPRQAKVYSTPHPSVTANRATSGISCSYSAIRAGASIFQTVYTSYTLYRARGDQIDRFGYAAFGLTVAPYAVMSVINLVGSLLTPDYPSLYMVHSDVMQEAMDRGGYFDGVVGTLETRPKAFLGPIQYNGTLSVSPPSHFSFIPQEEDYGTGPLQLFPYGGNAILIPNHPNFERTDISNVGIEMYNWQGHIERGKKYQTRSFFVGLFVSCIPIGIVGYLSKFEIGASTNFQRAWTMTWLVVGTQVGYTLATRLLASVEGNGRLSLIGYAFLFLCYPVPAAAGLYAVAGMLKEFGNCIRAY